MSDKRQKSSSKKPVGNDEVEISGGPVMISRIATKKGAPKKARGEGTRSYVPSYVTEKAKPVQRDHEVSKIHGLAEKSHDLPSALGGVQTASRVMGDDYIGRRWKILKYGILGSVATFCVAYILFPEVGEKIETALTDVTKSINDFGRHQEKVKLQERKTKESIRQKQLAAKVTADFVRSSCEYVVKTSLDRIQRYPMVIQDRLKVAQCFLIYDDPKGAGRILKVLTRRLHNIPEKILDGRKPHTMQRVYHALLTALVRQGRFRDAESLALKRCRIWQMVHSCTGKLMTMVHRGFVASASDGFRKMLATPSRLDGEGSARFWLAAAKLAAMNGQDEKAKRRFTAALQHVPKTSYELKKTIYGSYALFLYQSGRMNTLRAVVKRGLRDLKKVERGAKVKIKLLHELATPARRERTLKAFLGRPELALRARGDLELLEVLGPESITFHVEHDYLKLLRKSRNYHISHLHAEKSVIKKIDLWEVRATMARKRFEEALSLIGRYEKKYGRNHTSQHLRGISYMQMSENQKFQRLAALELGRAVRTRRNWESMYALGVALVRSGRLTQVPSVINDLDKLVTTSGQAYWFEMLKIEWYIATGKHKAASSLLQKWISESPDRFMPRALLLKSQQKLANQKEVRRIELLLDDLNRRVRYTSTPEALSSPIGPMALAKRPI